MRAPLFLCPAFIGELRDIRLFAFSIETDEAQMFIPTPLRARNFRGRALVSMADISMCRLRPMGCPAWLGISYRHIVLRMLIDDGRYNHGEQHGAWFFRSFTAEPWVAKAGNVLTEFSFYPSTISSSNRALVVKHGGHCIRCEWEDTRPSAIDEALLHDIRTLDKAYFTRNGRVFQRSIERSSWLPEPILCHSFSCSWFESIRFEGLFSIPHPVSYKWFPPKEVHI